MANEAAVVIGIFLIIIVIVFIAFLIYHFITKCKNCPAAECTPNTIVVQETKSVKSVKSVVPEDAWYAMS